MKCACAMRQTFVVPVPACGYNAIHEYRYAEASPVGETCRQERQNGSPPVTGLYTCSPHECSGNETAENGGRELNEEIQMDGVLNKTDISGRRRQVTLRNRNGMQ